VQPSGLAASNSSARRRLGLGLRLLVLFGISRRRGAIEAVRAGGGQPTLRAFVDGLADPMSRERSGVIADREHRRRRELALA
jgi:hypothetical protein